MLSQLPVSAKEAGKTLLVCLFLNLCFNLLSLLAHNLHFPNIPSALWPWLEKVAGKPAEARAYSHCWSPGLPPRKASRASFAEATLWKMFLLCSSGNWSLSSACALGIPAVILYSVCICRHGPRDDKGFIFRQSLSSLNLFAPSETAC